MTDSQNKTDLQKKLFDEIARRLPPRLRLVDELADRLNISIDAAYRRLRGEKIMDISECSQLCSWFGVSLDAIMGLPARHPSDYTYTPLLDVQGSGDYLLYMQSIASRLERLAEAPGAEIVLSAVDVPFFRFMPYRELTLFKLFAWTTGVYGDPGSFEEFVRTMTAGTGALFDIYDRIADAYRRIPSREIWTENTVDTFLKLVRYNFELGLFADPSTALSLCRQFGELLDTLQSQADTGSKGEADLGLFLSEVDLENNFILLHNDSETGCILKLFTINSLYITNGQFCSETLHWLDQLSRRSTLISVTSERERHRFFAGCRQKIRLLTNLIGQ